MIQAHIPQAARRGNGWQRLYVFAAGSVDMADAHWVDELVSGLSPERAVTWSAPGLGVDRQGFYSVTNRLFELEDSGAVEILSISRDRGDGQSWPSAVRFVRRG